MLMSERSVGALLVLVGLSTAGCSSPAPPPNLPPPEYETPRGLEIPQPEPMDEDFPPMEEPVAPLPPPVPDTDAGPEPTTQDAGEDAPLAPDAT